MSAINEQNLIKNIVLNIIYLFLMKTRFIFFKSSLALPVSEHPSWKFPFSWLEIGNQRLGESN